MPTIEDNLLKILCHTDFLDKLKYYCQLLNTKDYYGIVNLNELDSKNIDKSINLVFLKDLFYHLSKTEPLFFKNIYSVYKSDKSCYRDTYDLDYINNNNVNIFIYKNDYIQFNQNEYKTRYYKFYGITDVETSCKDYINGLNWVIGYYNNHCHDNWSWCYSHHAVPFASDIFEYLKLHRQYSSIFYKSVPFDPLEQLLMVLPKDSLLEIMSTTNIDLYRKLYRMFNTNSKQLLEYYPDNICLDMINKEYLWQSKIFLKQFNSQIINIFL